MTRVRAALFAVTLWAAPAAAQVVGHLPSASPYSDIVWKQSVSVFAGGFNTGNDPAGVGPQPGWLSGVKYDLRIGGPVSLVTRLSMGPTTRRVLNPTKPKASRYIGDESSTLMAGDVGLAMNLTGQKSYHRLIPVLSGGLGFVTDFKGTPDVGNYSFGTRFLFTWGLGVRYHTNGRWEPRADFTNYVWQIQYPST